MSNPEPPPLVFDRAGIRQLDKRAMAECGMPGLDLMERAAKGATAIALTFLKPGHRVLIACGSGNNGGDGWAMARLLHQLGHDIQVWAPTGARPGTDAAANEARALALNVPICEGPQLPEADLVIDALLGTGLDGLLHRAAIDSIEKLNAHGGTVIAIDLPSGMHADTGLGQPIAVQADDTATFVGLKIGMLQPHAMKYTGAVHVADIGIPIELARSLAVIPPDA